MGNSGKRDSAGSKVKKQYFETEPVGHEVLLTAVN